MNDQSTKQPVMLEGACHEFEILPDNNKLYVDVTNPLSVSLILNFNDNSVFFFCFSNTSKQKRESEMST